LAKKKAEDYTPDEIRALLAQLKHAPPTDKVYDLGSRHIQYGVISDYHKGNKCSDQALFDFAVKTFKQRKVDFIVDGGDSCDGFYRDRPGHVFELDLISVDDQLDGLIEDYSQFGDTPIYGITGNHVRNSVFNLVGYDIGRRLEERLPNYHCLGADTGTLVNPDGHKIMLIHPDGGSAYSISYRPQKIAESMEGGSKPSILHIGHYHKSEYLFYRNIHIIQNGTLESQTPFMRNRHLSAHKGFWVIEARFNKEGVTKFSPDFYPGY